MSKASLLELCHGEKKYVTFSISENNESLLSNCRAKKMYEIVNKTSKIFYISIYRHLQKCLYKGLCPKLSTNVFVSW